MVTNIILVNVLHYTKHSLLGAWLNYGLHRIYWTHFTAQINFITLVDFDGINFMD